MFFEIYGTTSHNPKKQTFVDKSIIINQLSNMKLSIGFEQLLGLVNQLSEDERTRLIAVLQRSSGKEGNGVQAERQLGKYEGQIWMSDDFNDPLEEFEDYM